MNVYLYISKGSAKNHGIHGFMLEVDHSDGKRQLERKKTRLNESVMAWSGKMLQLSK